MTAHLATEPFQSFDAAHYWVRSVKPLGPLTVRVWSCERPDDPALVTFGPTGSPVFDWVSAYRGQARPDALLPGYSEGF